MKIKNLDPNYYKTKKWLELRYKVIERDKHCLHCSSTENLEVHHLTYKHFKEEFLNEVATLCDNCHDKLSSDEWIYPYYKLINNELITYKSEKEITSIPIEPIYISKYVDLISHFNMLKWRMKKYTNEKDIRCYRNIPQGYAKNELVNVHIRMETNDRYISAYMDFINIINNTKNDEIIYSCVESEYNKLGYSNLNILILDYIICRIGKLKRNAIEYKGEDDSKKGKFLVSYTKDESIPPCEFFNINLELKHCEKCKKAYTLNVEYCQNVECGHIKGAYKGKLRRTTLYKTKRPICDCLIFKNKKKEDKIKKELNKINNEGG